MSSVGLSGALSFQRELEVTPCQSSEPPLLPRFTVYTQPLYYLE
jgi:hypothetical protein